MCIETFLESQILKKVNLRNQIPRSDSRLNPYISVNRDIQITSTNPFASFNEIYEVKIVLLKWD